MEEFDLRAVQRGRVFLYRFLAGAFLGPAEADTLRCCWNREFLASLGAMPEGMILGQAIAATQSYGEKQWQRLEEEYRYLFDDAGTARVYPWASVYRSREHILNDEHTAAVKLLYKCHGFRAVPKDNGPIDHIGIECEFLAFLGTAAPHTDKPCPYGEARGFLRKHLLPWVGKFCLQLQQNSTSDFYNGLALFFAKYVEYDDWYLSLRSGSEPPVSVLQEGAGKAAEEFLQLCRQAGPLSMEPERKKTEAIAAMEPAAGETIVMTAGRNNCGGCCPIKVYVRDGAVVRLGTDDEPETEDTLQLRACVRGRAYRKTYFSPDRLKYPLRRIGARGEGRFERISWTEAVETVAAETVRIRNSYGPGARYVNYAWGCSGSLQPQNLGKRLLALDGGFLDFYNTYSSAATSIATPYTYGTTQTGNTPADYVHAKLILLWGHNPAETIFGTNTMYYLQQARRAGAKVIVIDPRYSDTAMAIADQWIGLRPTTDNALMDAMAYTIITHGLHDQTFLDRYCLGFDREHLPVGIDGRESYRSYIMGETDGVPKTPAWAERITGVPANVIWQLGLDYGSIKPAALLQGYGPQRHAYGEQPVRGGTVLAALTGNVGISGGSAAGAGHMERHKMPGVPVPENPYPGRIPCYTWTQAVDAAAAMNEADWGLQGVHRLESNIKMIWNLSGQCLLNQHGDINRTKALLQDPDKVEFLLCSDIFMTPSAKFADILLPGTSMFEEDNLRGPWNAGDYICSVSKAVEPLFECRPEYDWLLDVAGRLGLAEAFSEGHKTMYDWCETLYEAERNRHPELPEYKEFRRRGFYKWQEAPRIAFQKQIEDPLRHPFPTPSGKIEIFSPRLYALQRPQEIPAVPKYIKAWEGPEDPLAERYPLQMIGWHYGRRCHSTHDNNPWLEEAKAQEMWMNPLDAQGRGIQNGERVEVFNDRGRMRILAKVTTRIVPGVVAVPQGAWYTPDKDGVDLRGSINTLTSLRPTPLAHGNGQHTNLVEVRKSEGRLG